MAAFEHHAFGGGQCHRPVIPLGYNEGIAPGGFHVIVGYTPERQVHRRLVIQWLNFREEFMGQIVVHHALMMQPLDER